jgi:hypothetical protein
MRIEPATLAKIQYVAEHLRDADRKEFSVTRSPTNLVSIAVDAWIADVSKVALTDDGDPAFVFGFHVVEREARIWGFGTERAPEVATGVTKHCLAYMMPLLLSLDIDRAACFVHAGNDLSKRWLSFLGFVPEATVSDIGPEREDLILYARGRNAERHPRKSRHGKPARHKARASVPARRSRAKQAV